MAQFDFWVPQRISTSQKSQMHHRAFRRAPALKEKRPGYILGLQGITLPRWWCLGEGGGLLQHLEPQWEVTLASQSYLGPFPTRCSREQCLTPQCGRHQPACWLEIIQGGYCKDTVPSSQPYPAPTTPVITLIAKEGLEGDGKL